MQPAYAPAGPRRAQGRATDRRRGAGELLRTVTSGLNATREVARVRERFEEELRALVRARSIRVYDGALAAPARCGRAGDRHSGGGPAPASPDRGGVRPGALARWLDLSGARMRPPRWPRCCWRSSAPRAAHRCSLACAATARRRSSDRARRSARARADRARGGDRFHGADRGRIGHRQGTRRAPDPRAESRGARVRSSRSTARRSSRRCSRRSCSASRSAPPPACAAGAASSSTRDDGTLFLDEVSDLSPAAQAKLLRAIQDLSVERVGGSGARRVDTRIIVATNRPLSELVEQGRFRLDLYYRLQRRRRARAAAARSGATTSLELARYFLERHRTVRPLQLSAAAADALLAYDWPGNVRELERVIERAVALAGPEYARARRSAAGAARRLRRRAGAVAARPRVDARVGQPLRAARARALRATTSGRPAASSASRITRCGICASVRNRCTRTSARGSPTPGDPRPSREGYPRSLDMRVFAIAADVFRVSVTVEFGGPALSPCAASAARRPGWRATGP